MTTTTEIKERPILFNAEMVRAILAGRKTQTRRILKPQPRENLGYMACEGGAIQCGADYPDGDDDFIKCPYGKPGNRLNENKQKGIEKFYGYCDLPRIPLKFLPSEGAAETPQDRPPVNNSGPSQNNNQPQAQQSNVNDSDDIKEVRGRLLELIDYIEMPVEEVRERLRKYKVKTVMDMDIGQMRNFHRVLENDFEPVPR